MIEAYMPADQLMALAWRDCLRWAIGYEPILDAFSRDTGIKLAPLRTALDLMICETTGEGEAVARQFIEWFNANIWGKV